tara:strand:+ start:5242 stop:5478 length:237 start_codon:yes stop_codon:yes gene_type:complete
MLFCEKKIFNKFLFFSIIFLCFSFFFNGVIVSANQVDVTEQPKNITKTTSDCMTQQRQIISSLEKIEYNLSARKLEKK